MINELETRGFNGGGSTNMMFAFLAGASFGAAAGLLLAPRAGKESREQLRDYFEKTRGKLQTAARKSAGMAREAVSHLREEVSLDRQPGFRKS